MEKKNVPKRSTTEWCCCCWLLPLPAAGRCCLPNRCTRELSRGADARDARHFPRDDVINATDCQPDLRFRETDIANRANHRASVSAAWRRAPPATDAPSPSHAPQMLCIPARVDGGRSLGD